MILARNWKEKPALNVDRSQFKHQENEKREWLRTQTNFPLQCKANVKEISADVILFPSQENVKGVTGSSRCQSPISEPLNHHRHQKLMIIWSVDQHCLLNRLQAFHISRFKKGKTEYLVKWKGWSPR